MREQKRRVLFASIFGLDFLCLVTGLTLLHLNDQYTGYRDTAFFMLLISFFSSFFIAALACMQYSFKLSLKRTGFIIFCMTALGVGLFLIGGAIIAATGRA